MYETILIPTDGSDPATTAARDAVEHVAAAAPASVEVHTHVVEGRPARMLATAIDDYDADLVAMGTHGRSGVDRYLFGSLAERTLRTATRPVLVVGS